MYAPTTRQLWAGALAAATLSSCAFTPEQMREEGLGRTLTAPGNALDLARCYVAELDAALPATINALRELPPDRARITARVPQNAALWALFEFTQSGSMVQVSMYALPAAGSRALDRWQAALAPCLPHPAGK